MKPILGFFGHHKCGSTWAGLIVQSVCQSCNLKIADHYEDKYFDGDISAFYEREPFEFWMFRNADISFVRFVDVRGFHVCRDPRDVIVSGYFSHLLSHPDWGWPRLRHYRPYLRSLSKRDGLLAEMEFCAPFLAHMLMWDYAQPNILEVRFEDLVRNPQAEFENVFRFLGLAPERISVERLNAIVDGYSFRHLSGGRSVGVEDPASHYRKGVHGDWRNHFEPCHVDYFKKLYNPLLLTLGYETDEKWV